MVRTGSDAVICFDDYRLDLRSGCLSRVEREIMLRPKCYELLLYLVENAGRLVSKDEVTEAIWPDVVATDESVSRCVSDLRSALQDRDHSLIRTVRGRGFRFTAPVSRAAAEPEPVAASAQPAFRAADRLEPDRDDSGLPAPRTNPADRPEAGAPPVVSPPDGPAAPAKPKLGEPVIGHSFTLSVPAERFNVPLPEGIWTGLVAMPINDGNAIGTAYFLGRIEAGQLVGAIRIFAASSKDQPGTGFAQATCKLDSPDNIFLVNEGCIPAGSQSFWAIQNWYNPYDQWADRTVRMTGLERTAGRVIMERGVKFPQDFVRLKLSRFEKWGLLEVDYLFTTDVDGISSKTVSHYRESDWNSAHIIRFPEKQAYAGKLKLWGKAFWPGFKAAFAAAAPQPEPESSE